MTTRVVRACPPKFNGKSRPFLVTNGRDVFWVEDAPNMARTLPVGSEADAEKTWSEAVTLAQALQHLKCANDEA